MLPLVLFAALTAAAVYESAWDRGLQHVVARHVPELGDLVEELIPAAGASIAAAAVGFFALTRRPQQALFWALAVAGPFVLDPVLKDAIERPSPDASGYSFPSGHATLSFAVVMAAVLTAPSRWRPALVAAGLLFLIAYGGVIVESQVHYPSDVVGGWCIACAWTGGLWLLIPRARRPSARGPDASAAGESADVPA